MAKDFEHTTREWLAEYKSLADSAISAYAEGINKREDVQAALMRLFSHSNESQGYKKLLEDLLQPVCHQLFEFYKSELKELKHFTINLFPSIILSHIVASSFTEVTYSAPTDTLILSIFALENITKLKDDSPGLEIPQLFNRSIYHDPMKGIFADRVMVMQNPGRRFYQVAVLPDYNCIIPSNRFQILNKLLTIYCEHIAVMKRISLTSLCSSCTFLASSGFQWESKYLTKNENENSNNKPGNRRRFQLGVEFSLTLLHGVYFSLYNGCWEEGFVAVEAMQRRGKRELIPQVMFLANAIMNSARSEARGKTNVASMEKAPYGLSSATLTPLLVRENSRKGRFAATAKSIRDHRWQHNNEEISGDLSKSVQSNEIHGTKLTPTVDGETSKPDRHPSPSKLLKAKMKKSGSQMTGVTDKTKSPVPSTGERKQVRKSVNQEEGDTEKIMRSPSQKKENIKKSSPQVSRTHSRTSVNKQASFDETMFLSVTGKCIISGSKSTSDSLSAGNRLSLNRDLSNHRSESPSKHNVSSSPLLEKSKLESETSSEGHDLLNGGERSKESIPLLPTAESSISKQQNLTKQTVF